MIQKNRLEEGRTERQEGCLTRRNGRAWIWKIKKKDVRVSREKTSLPTHPQLCRLFHLGSKTNALNTAEDDSESDSDSITNDQADIVSLRVRPPQSESEVNGSIGGEKGWAEKIVETPEMLQKRLEGQKRAEEREAVRCVARRLCAFGIVVDNPVGEGDGNIRGAKGKGKGKIKEKEKDVVAGDGDDNEERQKERRRKCEAVMSGNVVEASYAKGEWGIRWRE